MINFTQDQIAQCADVDRQPAGGYVCRILWVTNDTSKMYLKVGLEIAEGNYAGLFQKIAERSETGHSPGTLYITLKPEHKFKSLANFLKAVTESNPGYVWNQDENSLVGKIVGYLFGEEEYLSDKGQVLTSVKPFRPMAADKIRSGAFGIPQKKRLTMSQTTQYNQSTYPDEIEDPFANQ